MRSAAACAVLLALLGASAAATASPTNLDVTAAVRQRLLAHGGVSAERVAVQANDGVAVLSGTVDSLLVQQRAARLAETVKGVRGVVNLVRVSPEDRPASDIQADVRTALAADPAIAGQPIQAGDIGGTVTLGGTVQSAAEKRLAELAARGVLGVRDVDNSLVIDHRRARPAAAIKADIEQTLSWDPWLSGLPITVAVDAGNVVLSGAVANEYEKRRADKLARVDGVAATVDRLRTDPELADAGGNSPAGLSDDQVEAATAAVFDADPRLRRSRRDLHVTVAAAGQAFLYGIVADYDAKRAARQDARNTVGVTRVVDGVTVQPASRPPDVVVRHGVERALLHDPYIALDDLDVSVRNGRVLLRGVVPTLHARQRAKAIAGQVAGVTDVVDRLAVLREQRPLAQAPQTGDLDTR